MGSRPRIEVLEAERQRPLDASDIDTPRGQSAKAEVQLLRALLASHAGSDGSSSDTVQSDHSLEYHETCAPGIQDYLAHIFRAADTDGSGVLSYDEFTLNAQAAALRLTEADLAALELHAQWQPGGDVTWQDFVTLAPQLLYNISHDPSHPNGETSAEGSSADISQYWCELFTPEGVPYYYNKWTQESGHDQANFRQQRNLARKLYRLHYEDILCL